MKKKVWIINHYATNSYFSRGGRHYWFAENLIKQGYEPTVFCANTRHNSDNVIELKNELYFRDFKDNIPFVFIKAPKYKGNGKSRIINMISFYRNFFPVAKKYAEKFGKPDVILASSVHPLTLVAGIKAAKKFGVPCICEVRDLWPETFVAYGLINKRSLILKLLYVGEKWIYKKADKIIFTMEGGKDYIVERGWDVASGGPINFKKVYHINNGVDLEAFDYNKRHFQIIDQDLEDVNTFKVVYTGSIRKVNEVGMLLDVASILKARGMHDIRFLIWGDGEELVALQQRVIDQGLSNVSFKGRVDKKFIPYITCKSQLNIALGQSNSLYRFGVSLNKMFDYFASGKPTLFTFKCGYSLIDKFKAGVELADCSPNKIAESIMLFRNLSNEEYRVYCLNALKAAEEYDFKKLTDKLIDIIEV